MKDPMSTALSWLNEIVETSGLSRMADFEAARLIYNKVACDSVSPTTFRRYPIPYKVVGRTRRYFVEDIVDFAKRRAQKRPKRASFT